MCSVSARKGGETLAALNSLRVTVKQAPSSTLWPYFLCSTNHLRLVRMKTDSAVCFGTVFFDVFFTHNNTQMTNSMS